MSRRDKLIERMRVTPGNIRFSEAAALLRYEGFVLFNQRGSHCTYHHADGRLLTIVKSHRGRKTCQNFGPVRSNRDDVFLLPEPARIDQDHQRRALKEIVGRESMHDGIEPFSMTGEAVDVFNG